MLYRQGFPIGWPLLKGAGLAFPVGAAMGLLLVYVVGPSMRSVLGLGNVSRTWLSVEWLIVYAGIFGTFFLLGYRQVSPE